MNEIKQYDVAIIGGGTSGCACAYNCAKLGLKTILIEKNNFLGGLMTGGLVVPVMKSSISELNTDFYKLLVNTAKKYNAQITYKDGNDGWFNPEVLKIVLEDILTSDDIKNNLDILFETEVSKVITKNNFIEEIYLENLSGILSIPIVATSFIDSTGSGKFSYLAGAEFLGDYEILQQNSLRFIVGNVNCEEFAKFIIENDNVEDITNTYRDDINTRNEIHFTTASTWDTNRIWNMDKFLKQGVKDGILKDTDRAYFQVFSVAGGIGQVAFNCPRINNYKDDIYKASNELIEAKKAIYRLYNFCKIYFKGFENSIITNIATITGIREERRIKSKYIYKKDDLISSKSFNTPILQANYGIDIHSKTKNTSVLEKVTGYELPIEALQSFNIENLFAIGKLVGADFSSHSALRVQKSCMSMGEGVAKYIFSKKS